MRALKRALVNGGRPAGDGGSPRGSIPSLIGRARLSVAKVADLPLLVALRVAGAPGQMLYCLARRADGGRKGGST